MGENERGRERERAKKENFKNQKNEMRWEEIPHREKENEMK